MSVWTIATLFSLLLISCQEQPTPEAPASNPLHGEYISLSDFMPSELVLVLKPEQEAQFGMRSNPNSAAYTIEENKIIVDIEDGSQQIFLIDQDNPGTLIHEFTQSVFTKQ